jgi:hypothetical protein
MFNMRKTYVVLAIVASLLVAALAYLALAPGAENLFRSAHTVTDPALVKKSVVVFVRNPYKDDYGVTRIPGYIDNVGRQDIASVDVEIQLYDGEKRKELVKYTVEDVKAGARKTFDANAGLIDIGREARIKIKALEVYR